MCSEDQINCHKQLFLLILFFSVLSTSLFAQKSIRAKGNSGAVRVESFMTKDQAKEMAEELAMINAIENEFGQYVEAGADVHVADGRVNFDYIGSTQVRGEWIRTLDIKFRDETTEEKTKNGIEKIVWVYCDIVGEIRKCENRANLSILVLNCPQKACRETDFVNGEHMYLYFESPVDGYLSVYLDDGYEAFRLLPYSGMGTLNAIEIEGDKDYILFSYENSYDFDKDYKIDAAKLTTDRELEYNNVYVVFAEDKEYVKPILEDIQKLDNGYYIPRALPIGKFKEWLGDCRADMPDFQAKRIKISIEKQ